MTGSNELLSLAGIVALLGLAGKAAMWLFNSLWTRRDRRDQLLDERERRMTEATDERIKTLQSEIEKLSERLNSLSQINANQWTAIHLLVADALRTDPANPIISQAEAILGRKLRNYILAGVELPVSPLPDAGAGTGDEVDAAARP